MATATQKIKLLVVSFINRLVSGQPTQYKLAMQTPVVVTYSKFVQNIVNETGLSKTQCNAVLGAVAQCAGDYMALGNAVQIHPDLGTLKPRITVKSQPTEAAVTVKDITGIGIRFIATGDMATLLKGTQFQITGKGTSSDGESDLVDPNESDDSEVDNGGDNNGDNPGNDPGPATYRVTFKFGDGTDDALDLEAGATITYPSNTSGYQWPASKPTVMPAQDTTVTEVAISGGGGDGVGDI